MIQVKHFFDKDTYTLTYVVYDAATKDALVIDPVLNFDAASGHTWTNSIEEVISFVKKEDLKVYYVLETHAHADHLSGSQDLKKAFPNATLAIGERIKEVQSVFKGIFNLHPSFKTDGSQFDKLLSDGETVKAGSIVIKTIFTPGHTPACASYLIEDILFVGDAIFMPDYGTGRCDFPSGSAEALWDSIASKIYKLPDSTRIFVGHDYQPGGRELKWQTTVGEEKAANIQLTASMSKESFVNMRKARDATLDAPRLLFPSVQVNIDAGRLPEPESNGLSFLKMPLNLGQRKPK
jgi:glyoxylase-like metal-dependent hydrolase (beta-lactamase superfamily II)